MRLLSAFCLLLFSSVSFSQIEDLLRKSEFQNSNDIKIEIIPYICGFARNFSHPLTDLTSLQGNMVRPKDSALLKGLKIKVLPAFIGKINNNDTIKKPETKIVLRCGNRYLNETPLFVIDGVPQDSACLRTLDSNDIESIYILKDATASAIYGCRAARGVIIITTKSAKLRKFIIKDFLDGNRIPGATISFISADKKDTIMIAANESGVASTDKLKSSNSYSMTVSSVGYKTQRTIYQYFSNIKDKEVLLEKNVSACSEVVVTSSILYRRIRCYSGGVFIIGQK
jgi:TonB-dependent SusC/RagA subfamily outer membrane receptor